MIEIRATAKINGKIIEGNYRVTEHYSGFWIKSEGDWKQTLGIGDWKQTLGIGDFYDTTKKQIRLKKLIKSYLFGYGFEFAPEVFSKIRVTYTFTDTVSGKKI